MIWCAYLNFSMYKKKMFPGFFLLCLRNETKQKKSKEFWVTQHSETTYATKWTTVEMDHPLLGSFPNRIQFTLMFD